ncbi:MlaA family lipoprotein [Lysobacter claricitrinus]|uniref:MlaA family lipoprotein n=1 Tax=Lysobacter claricitrinus TaxID=3367728 RepID=UPI0037DBB272
MTLPAAPRRARRTGVPARSLLALALFAATAPAWAQDAATSAPASEAAAPQTDATVPPPADAPAAATNAPSSPQTPPTVDAAVPPATDAPQDTTTSETTGTTDAPVPDVAVDAAVPPAASAPPPTGDAAATTETTATDANATSAEGDFDALYGPTGGTNVERGVAGVIWDPWEPYNRKMHRLNNAVDKYAAHPLARAYVAVVPRPVRSGVSNFFSNLGQPITAINALLQGKPKLAAHALGRFVMNSTLGIGGVFDPATDAKLENGNEDFGQTLGVWGWKRSRYFELPLFGPRTVRDIVGMVGDAPLSPMRGMEEDKVRIPLQGLQLVDLRAQLMSTDALREGVQDDYTLVRDAWMQRRMYQINGEAGENLPEYLRDAPIVPVNAMPVRPGN